MMAEDSPGRMEYNGLQEEDEISNWVRLTESMAPHSCRDAPGYQRRRHTQIQRTVLHTVSSCLEGKQNFFSLEFYIL